VWSSGALGLAPGGAPGAGAPPRPETALAALLASSPLAATPDELRRAADEARGTDRESPVTIVLEDGRHSFDDEGRRTVSYRLVYRIERAAAVDEWGSTSAYWSPWYQARPSVRARVLTVDGVMHTLDPGTIAEQGVGEGDPALYGDRMMLRAPLPAAAAGAIVEEEIVTRDTASEFPDGLVGRWIVGHAFPMGVSRFVVEASDPLELRFRARRLEGAEPRLERRDGHARLELTRYFPEAFEDAEEGMPPDEAPWPYVAFSTGRSWAEVAQRYSAIVDAQLAGQDLRAEAKAVTRQATTTKEKAEALLAMVRKEVRYTGVEFGEAAIVPRPPAETRRRRYGDCKDQATLLVGLLRAAGLKAHVALIRSGFGSDVEEALPGLGEFNHAIVHVATTPPLWIDPVADHSRVGELPGYERDRLTLIAAPETTALTRTPDVVSAENRQVWKREVVLQEAGPARVVEVMESTGAIERRHRERYAASGREELEASIKEYLREELMAERFEEWTHVAPDDLSRTFTQRLVVPEAERGATDEHNALVVIRPEWVISMLPRTLVDDDEMERRSDYYFVTPFVAEYQYSIEPPPGYAPRPLPEDRAEALGSATLTRSFRAAADNTVAVTLRLDSGPRRVAAAQVATMREKAAAALAAPAIEVWFDQVGEAHLQAGRMREALSEFDGLVRLHPREARHHAQRARALLAAGLGEEARAAAHAGVAAEPDSAIGHRTLGWVMEHDVVGRRFKQGFDHDAAVAAYRKALEIDGDDALTRASLAILHEHDDRGARYGYGARLDLAIDEYQRLRSGSGVKDYDVNLMVCLLRTFRLDELRTLLADVEQSAIAKAMAITASAVKNGPEAAIDEARRSGPSAEDRRTSLIEAAGNLTSLRQYEEAAALLAEAANGAKNASELRGRASLAARLRRSDEIGWSPDDPAALMQRFLLASYGTDAERSLRDLMVSEWAVAMERDERAKREFQAGLRGLRSIAQRSGLPIEVFGDILATTIQSVVDGNDATGYRVSGTSTLGNTAENLALFARSEKGELRLVATEDAVDRIGVEALRLLASGDEDGARQWLDWAREIVTPVGGDDPLLDSPFARLWTKGSTAGREAIRAAAAALVSEGSGGAQVVATLEQSRATEADPAAQQWLDVALVKAYRAADRDAEALAIAERLLAAHPSSAIAFLNVGGALGSLERFEELQRVIDARLVREPNDPAALRMQAQLSSRRGEYGQAEVALTSLIARGKAGASDFNELAWLALVRGNPDERAIEQARRGVELSGEASYPVLHTLAALYAEVGRTTEAYQVLLRAIDASWDDRPHGEDWYVLGRVAEWYGLPQVARTCYARVERPEVEEYVPLTSYGLAARRLAAMKGGATAAGTVRGRPRPR